MEATIQEGSVGRKFSPVDKLKINLQSNGGESLWVPEESVQLEDLHTQNNGTYYVSSRGIYGWDTIIVDVDTSIAGGDNDDLWDDDDYWDETPDHDDWPGWDDLDPEAQEDFDDWMSDPDNLDPDDWPGWDDLDPEAQEDFDDWMSADEDLTDDWDQEPDEDWEDENLDDYDDIVGEDLDGDDVAIGVDEDGNLDEESCPASIKVMHVPDKTSYKEGETIDLDGLIVQAFDADGNPWSSPEYPDGYIPAHKLMQDSYKAVYDKSNDLVGMMDGGFLYKGQNGTITTGSVFPHYDDGRWTGGCGGGMAEVYHSGGWPIITMSYGGKTMGPFPVYYQTVAFKTEFYKGGSSAFIQYNPNGIGGNVLGLSAAETAAAGILDNAYMFKDNESGQQLNVEWESPCFENFSVNLPLIVTENNNEGSHHSGKF